MYDKINKQIKKKNILFIMWYIRVVLSQSVFEFIYPQWLKCSKLIKEIS